jgi:hypothetical protein
MKKSVFKIGRFFLVLGFSWICITGNAQEVKLSKKEQKEAMNAERLKNFDKLDTLLASRKFAFVTDRVQGSTGATVYNLIQVDEARVFVRCENPKNTSGGFSGARDNTTPIIGLQDFFLKEILIVGSFLKIPEILVTPLNLRYILQEILQELIMKFTLTLIQIKPLV